MSAHVISGLKKTRHELNQELQEVQRKLQRLDVEIRSLDAAILIYEPEYMADNGTLRQQSKNSFFIHGECVMLIREFFRDSEPGPHATTDIVAEIAAVKQLSLEDNKKLAQRFYMSVLRSLHHLAKNKGELKQLERENGIIRWKAV